MVKAMFDRVSLPNKLEVVSSYHHHTDTYEQVCMYNSYNLLRHTYMIYICKYICTTTLHIWKPSDPGKPSDPDVCSLAP